MVHETAMQHEKSNTLVMSLLLITFRHVFNLLILDY